ncbi:hypothetical protein ISCGN_007549 [Ixodes scapularis]
MYKKKREKKREKKKRKKKRRSREQCALSRNRDARGGDSFREPVPPRGTVPKKQSPLSARRWGEGAGLPGQRSGGGGWCVQAGEAIAIFSLLVCGSGYPTSRDVWSGPISSRKVSMHGFEGSPLGLF